MVEAADSDLIQSRRKAISVLFPYAILLARQGQREMLDAFSRAAKVSNSRLFMWHHIKPFIVTLFDKPNPPSLNYVLGIISPSIVLCNQPHNDSAVAWPAATPSYAEEADRSVVVEVLRVAFINYGQHTSAERSAIRQVRAFGDTWVLGSYLLLLWSKGNVMSYGYKAFTDEIQTSVREDFGGIRMWRHREGLIRGVDQMLDRLEQLGWGTKPYRELKGLLLEVDGGAEKILTRTPPWLICSGLLI